MDLRVFIESIVNKGGELISISLRLINSNHSEGGERHETQEGGHFSIVNGCLYI